MVEIPQAFRWLRHYPAKEREKVQRGWLMKRDGFRCLRCGATDDLTLDHMKPRSKGGTDDPENLQTLCRACNSQKGDRETSRYTDFEPPALTFGNET